MIFIKSIEYKICYGEIKRKELKIYHALVTSKTPEAFPSMVLVDPQRLENKILICIFLSLFILTSRIKEE